MTDRLTAKEAAALAGVAVSTWDSYVTRGYAPPADGRFGNQRYWLRSTVEQWKTSRAGQGARTDLETERGCSACGKPMKTGPYGVLIHKDDSPGHEKVSTS